MLILRIVTALSAALISAPTVAQDKKPGWLLQLVEAKARDVETAAAIATEGRELYATDDNKKTWEDYCKSAYQLAWAGNFREAIRTATKAFFLGESSGNQLARASASRDLTIAYALAGDLERAWYWSERLIEYSNGTGSWRSTFLSIAHGLRSNIHQRRGAYDDALRELEKSRDHTLRAQRAYLTLRTARIEHLRGNSRKGAELYDELLRDETVPFIRSSAFRGKAEIALAAGNAAQSRQLYDEALKEGDESRTPLTVMWYRLGLARTMLALGDKGGAAGELQTAVRLAENVSARFRSEEFLTGLMGNIQEVYELALEAAMDDGRYSEAFQISEMSRARAFTDLIRGRINHVGAAPEKAVGPEAIANVLPAETALVVYHVLPKRTAVWIVRNGTTPLGKWLPVGDEQLAKATRALRREIAEFQPSIGEAQPLYQQLIEPLGLREGETVLFIPHRSMHFLPFQALRGPKGWLVEERPIAVAPSASSLVAILAKASIPADSLLALGNPTPLSSNLPLLPGAEAEITQVASHFPKAFTYLRELATKSRLLKDGPTNAVLHVAAHAQVDDIDPMYSRIHLAASGTKHSDLEAHELYRVNFSNVRLVALSACDSGLGRVSGGDEFWGFKRTVLGAGARTLIASLWPVVDESTPMLMSRFYASLKKMSAAASLREGQLELIRSKEHMHPLFWGAFTLVGDWR